ncbi:MAG TPA: hypothetical protein VD886_00330 [Herpetosiphonaceae bacterium]|nr:hypothetical protein [Herpetosiphonaceae bacterium]
MSDLHPAFNRATGDAIEHFRPLITVIAAIAHGDQTRRAEVEYLLPQIDNNGWQIAAPVGRIWAGERDRAALTAGLDANSAAIVGAILEAVEREQPDDEERRIAALVGEWRTVILTVAAACLDIDQARIDVEGFLPQLESQEQWRDLAGRIRLLLAGDHNQERLLAGLDSTDSVVLTAIFSALADPENLVALLRAERDRAAAEDEQ